MSISDEIANRCSEGRLFRVHPQISFNQPERTIFISEMVMSALHGPWATPKDARRLGRARAALDNFIEGRIISVRFPPSKSVEAFIALLEKKNEEVWEIRSRDPHPGVRIMGRFALQDVFIALLPVYREELDSDRNWHDAKLRCCTEWRNLFPTESPLTGNHPYDYISNNIFLV